MMRKLFFLLMALALALQSKADGDHTEAAGSILLESFRCESMSGTATQAVKTSLSSLKKSLDSITEKEKECQASLAAIGKLPDLESLLSQMDSYGSGLELKKTEALIEESLRDLAFVRTIPPGNPNRALYPDESTLQAMVADARVELLKLRVSNKIEQSAKERQNYISGVSQLDSLAVELASSLRKNSECYQKHPVLRRQVMTGLLGISGLFAQSPAGIGITLAGRVLQNIFEISDAHGSSKTSNFEASSQAMLVSGLSCTLETLGSQHCRLVRQEALLSQLAKGPCSEGKCSPKMRNLMSLMEKGNSANKAVSEITRNLGSKGDNPADQAEVKQVNLLFSSSSSSFEATLSDLKDKLKAAERSKFIETKRADIRSSLSSSIRSFASRLFGNSPGNIISGDEGLIREIQQKMSEAEKERHALNFVYDEAEYDAAIQKTSAVISSSPLLRKKYQVDGEGGSVGTVKIEEAARNALLKAFIGNVDEDIPEAKRLYDSMATLEMIDKVRARLDMYKSSILQQFRFLPKDEQIANFTISFLADDTGKPSTLKHLENIKGFFDSIPDDFMASRGKLLKIPALKAEVEDVIKLGKEIETAPGDLPEDTMKTLYTKVTSLLDHTRGFKEKMAVITQAVSNHQSHQLASASANTQDMNDLVFMQYNDFLTGVYDLPKPYQRQTDVKNAIALSGGQIDAFGNFFQLYQEKAINLLNKYGVDGKKFNAGLSENISESLKDHFCIQTLALTEIPKDIKTKECANAVIRQGNTELKFSDFANLPHKERVCAYGNFLNKINVARSKRESPPSAPATK